MKPKREANRITNIWRIAGPGSHSINLESVVYEILNQSSEGDIAEICSDKFDKFDGALLRKENKKNTWIIVLNKRINNIGRRRFTLAHEIGHFVGHRYTREKFECTRKQLHDFSEDDLEVEANEFSSQLLMPPDLIRPYVHDEFTIAGLSDIANQLAVSKQAAALRWVEISKKRPVGFVVSRDGMVCWGRTSAAAYKRGIFFRSGIEVPAGSLTFAAKVPGQKISASCDPGIWHGEYGCSEHVYFTSIGDYTYTCLDFGASL